DDAREHPGGAAGGSGHRRRVDPAERRHRGCRGPGRGPAGGDGLNISSGRLTPAEAGVDSAMVVLAVSHPNGSAPMTPTLDRRSFLAASAALPALPAAGAADKPNDKIVLAVLGVRGRGKGLLGSFTAFDDVEVAYLCAPDLNVVPAALKALPARHKRQPK